MPDRQAASERFAVAVAVPPRDHATVQTTFGVARWDADQTAWALRRLGYGDTRPPLPQDQGLTPAQFAAAGVAPYQVTRQDNCNAVVQAGWVALLGGIAGTSITNKFSATYGRIGIGTSTTAVTWGDVYLGGDTGSGSTTSYYQLCGAAPTITTSSGPATLVFTATFGTGSANFAWQEFATDNYNSSGVTGQGLGGAYVFFNHGISNQGTKASGQTWTATETIQFGYPHADNVVGGVS